MSRVFEPAELKEMRMDMRRNPGERGLAIVAQLHGCTEQDVLQALGLETWPENAPPTAPAPPKRIRRYPNSLREQAINAMLDGTEEAKAFVAGAEYMHNHK